MKFCFLKSDWFLTQIWLSPRFTPISLFYKNCNQIGPQTPLQTLKFFKLGCNLKICLGGSLATSNFCVLTQGDFGTTSYSEIFECFWRNLFFFKSDVSCTHIWISPRFSPISCFCQYFNQIVLQTALQTLNIFKLGWNLKICLGGSLATSNPYIFTERAFRKTSYFERFEFFGEICIF